MLVFDALINLARMVSVCRSGEATGGTTSTLIDTVHRLEEDDAFNGQTLLITSGSNAKTTRRITDFVNTTATLTVSPVWSAAIASGVNYLISQTVRADLVQSINQALDEIGNITQVDESLVVVAGQTEYALPSGVYNVMRVEVASSGTADYDYQRAYGWMEIGGKLYFDSELNYTAGRKLRLFYNARHSAVDEDTDTISDLIPLPLLTAIAAYYYELMMFRNDQNVSMKDNPLIQMANNARNEAKMRYKVKRIVSDPKLGET